MEHGKRLGREQVDVQNADRKQPADERRMQVLYDSNTSRSCAPNKTGGRRTMMHVLVGCDVRDERYSVRVFRGFGYRQRQLP